MKPKRVVAIIIFMCCMFGCSTDQMEVTKNKEGELVFNRSKPLPNVLFVSVSLESDYIWRVVYGSREFNEIKFGVLPNFSDHRTKPKQTIPDGEKLRELYEGEKIIIILEFRKDYFPSTPSSSAECWEVIIPRIGEKSQARKVKCR